MEFHSQDSVAKCRLQPIGENKLRKGEQPSWSEAPCTSLPPTPECRYCFPFLRHVFLEELKHVFYFLGVKQMAVVLTLFTLLRTCLEDSPALYLQQDFLLKESIQRLLPSEGALFKYPEASMRNTNWLKMQAPVPSTHGSVECRRLWRLAPFWHPKSVRLGCAVLLSGVL